jgi:hypothetical protein
MAWSNSPVFPEENTRPTAAFVSGPSLRQAALDAALELHINMGGLRLCEGVSREQTITDAEQAVRETAETFAAWLNGTVRLLVTRSAVTKQTPGSPAGTTLNEENAVQIHDDEQFTLSVHTTDAKGFETADQIDWAVDNTDAVTLQVSDDGRSCTVVAGQPGSAVITVTDSATDPVLSATEAVDVVAGGTATITLTEGDVSKQ